MGRPAAMIEFSPPPAEGLPLVCHPADGSDMSHPALDLLAAERPRLEDRLLVHGALLLRGFGLGSVADFQRLVALFCDGDPLDYAGGASPRSRVAGASGVYTSTDYPPAMALSLHNELSYAESWPKRLFFYCVTAPASGGETTLGDSRRILAAIDPRVLEPLRARGIRYVRNLSPHKGSGYSWQDAFETDDPQAAEQGCRRIGTDYTWRPGGFLRLNQVRPATAVHPVTGEEVWFNQADGFHPSALDPDTYREQLALCGSEADFRLNVGYGDGAPIEPAALDHIRSVLRAHTIPHRWREGDVLILDNLLAAHGRAPFAGPRKIVVAMG